MDKEIEKEICKLDWYLKFNLIRILGALYTVIIYLAIIFIAFFSGPVTGFGLILVILAGILIIVVEP